MVSINPSTLSYPITSNSSFFIESSLCLDNQYMYGARKEIFNPLFSQDCSFDLALSLIAKITSEDIENNIISLPQLQQLMKENPLLAETSADFKIYYKSKAIPVHKAILAAQSSYFKALFTHPLEENIKQCLDFSFLDEIKSYIDPAVIESFINLIEIGELPPLGINFSEILFLTDYVECLKLRNQCLETALKQVQKENVSYLLRTAVEWDIQELKWVCLDIIQKDFVLLSEAAYKEVIRILGTSNILTTEWKDLYNLGEELHYSGLKCNLYLQEETMNLEVFQWAHPHFKSTALIAKLMKTFPACQAFLAAEDKFIKELGEAAYRPNLLLSPELQAYEEHIYSQHSISKVAHQAILRHLGAITYIKGKSKEFQTAENLQSLFQRLKSLIEQGNLNSIEYGLLIDKTYSIMMKQTYCSSNLFQRVPTIFCNPSYFVSDNRTWLQKIKHYFLVNPFKINLHAKNCDLLGTPYAFQNLKSGRTSNYALKSDGSYLVYVAQQDYPEKGIISNKTLMALDIPHNTLKISQLSNQATDIDSSLDSIQLCVDDVDQIWVTNPLGELGKYELKRLDLSPTQAPQLRLPQAGSIIFQHPYTKFSIFRNDVYYIGYDQINNTKRYLKQNLTDQHQITVLHNDQALNWNPKIDHIEYAISINGRLLAYSNTKSSSVDVLTLAGLNQTYHIHGQVRGLEFDPNDMFYIESTQLQLLKFEMSNFWPLEQFVLGHDSVPAFSITPYFNRARLNFRNGNLKPKILSCLDPLSPLSLEMKGIDMSLTYLKMSYHDFSLILANQKEIKDTIEEAIEYLQGQMSKLRVRLLLS
ncbi:MAG: kelch-like protein 20 [Chlamydiales bacterium]|jgi:hypothetical protein|nr:kelch-like protein 20 [Chlamydiales bacterium]